MSSAMTDEAICRLIGTAVGRAAGKSGVAPGMSLRSDLGVDSIGLMSVVFMLEEQAGIDAFSHIEQFIGAEYVSDIIKIVRQT
jgi:acyl carrier protein